MRIIRRAPGALAAVIFLLPAVTHGANDSSSVDFNRQVRPILSESCYQCHGPDVNKRKADLRLDQRDGLFRSTGGTTVVVPGKPGASELLSRITADDPELRMPPPKSGRQLSREQIALVKRWITEGRAVEGALGLPCPDAARVAGRAQPERAGERNRPFHRDEAGRRAARADSGGRPPNPDPPAQLRPHRLAPHPRRGRGIHERPNA